MTIRTTTRENLEAAIEHLTMENPAESEHSNRIFLLFCGGTDRLQQVACFLRILLLPLALNMERALCLMNNGQQVQDAFLHSEAGDKNHSDG